MKDPLTSERPACLPICSAQTHSAIIDFSDALLLCGSRAFTWNPNPLRYKSYDPNDQYLSCLMWAFKNCTKVFNNYIFVPELTSDGNVHIHGIFTLFDKLKYYKKFLPRVKALGFVKIKERVDAKWLKYIFKEWTNNSDIFNLDTLNHNNYDMFNLKSRCEYLPKLIKGPIEKKRPITYYLNLKY